MLHDMTKGSVRGHVVRMTLFMLAGFVIQTLYSLIDMPSLIASAVRVVVFVGAVLVASRRADFTLRFIWIASVATVVLQVGIAVWLLRVQFAEDTGPERLATDAT